MTALAYDEQWESRLPAAASAGGEVGPAAFSAHDAGSPLRYVQTLSSLPEEARGKSTITRGVWKARAAAAAPPPPPCLNKLSHGTSSAPLGVEPSASGAPRARA